MKMNFSEKMQEVVVEMDVKKYLEGLKEECRKITVFQRELPLCLGIINREIESCTQQLSGTTTVCFNGGQSDCSEQTSGECPVLEEFIPVKKGLSSELLEEERVSLKMREENKYSEKKQVGQSDWLKSAQLWNPDPDVKEDSPKKKTVVEVKKNGGAFQPFHAEKTTAKTNSPVENGPAATVFGTAEIASQSSSRREEKDEQGKRKLRRCWSPELHRRFLSALQQLGGSQVATPKQIRELMKVDGLTNDEVKSHLQKYRLHTRRSSPVHNNGVKQSPQYVVVGGIWVPPSEYTVAPAKTVARDGNEFYAVPTTVAQGCQGFAVKRPQPKRLVQSSTEGRRISYGGEDGIESGHHSNSPATSSSSHLSSASLELCAF